ncbi:MAG TPA: hypothetical protein VI056_05900 [Candidatus Limnocylindria bacterium]
MRGDLYIFARTATVDGTVDGDLVVFGRQVTVKRGGERIDHRHIGALGSEEPVARLSGAKELDAHAGASAYLADAKKRRIHLAK